MKTTTPLGFFLLCFLTCINLAQAQLSCGTEVDKARMEADALQNQALSQNQRGLFFPVNCLGKKLSITAYIFRDSLGADGISQATIQSAVQTMNNDFSPMCLSFDVCKYVYVNNYNYNDFKGLVHEDEVYNLYYTPNTINIYFVKSLISKSGSAVCGYAYMPGGRDMIFLQKSCVGDGKTFSHEMGHFFGLYHTFETSNGVELINGSNCLVAGDLVCDTPADPGGSNGPDCQLAPYIQDAAGNWYVPHIGNIMSYYTVGCKCGFTTQQFNRMIQQYSNNRNYLW